MTPKECERIYNESYRAVYWTAMSLLRNEADAEDVVQDTFVTLLESYDTLQDKTKVVPWLKKICARKCLNLLSRTKTDAVEQEFFDNLEYVPEDFLPESIVESEERRKIIMDIIERSLSEGIRRTIILYYFDEMSTKEIAEAMGIAQGTVLWRLSFARNKIKKEVEKYEKENDTKLYAVALPFLTLLFIKESEMVPLRPMPSSLADLSASTVASTGEAGTAIAAEAIEKGTGIMIRKLIILIISTLFVGAAAAGIFFALRGEDEDSPDKDRKKADDEITATVTGEADELEEEEEEYEFGSEEYWLSKMFLIDVNNEAQLRKIADAMISCEPKLGEDKHILYDKVVAAIGKEPMSTGMWCNHNTFEFEFSFEHGYDGYDRLFDFGYWNYDTEPNPDVKDPGKVIAYEDNVTNPTRKASGNFILQIYDEARAQKAYKFYCDYITDYYAQYHPATEDNAIGYCLKCGDGYFEYYAYVRMLYKEERGVWQLLVENYFNDPELMAACEELKQKQQKPVSGETEPEQ